MTVTKEAERMMNRRQALATRLLWVCAAIGVVAAVTILLLFGVSTWTAIAFVLLLACPAAIAWALAADRKQRPPTSRSKT
jgi:membrane protein implicated in regulation of membrane protease activity